MNLETGMRGLVGRRKGIWVGPQVQPTPQPSFRTVGWTCGPTESTAPAPFQAIKRVDVLQWWAVWIAAFVLGISGAGAHQIAITQVTLAEEEGGNYLLRCGVATSQIQILGMPIIPPRCQWVEPAEGEIRPPGDLRFSRGGEPLTAADRILLPWRRNGVVVNALWHDGTSARHFFLSGPEGIVVELSQLRAGSGDWGDAAVRFTSLGVEHILKGLDHILFVAGLLLLVQGTRRLLATVTAFTLAHSVTLALSALGAVSLSQGLVDAVVALSIVFLAVENVHALRGQSGLAARRPWVVAFGFGLIHGLGFAGALNAIGLPRAEVPASLLFFNVGVELGQLGVIAAWLAGRWALEELALRWPQTWRLVPHYALGIVASVWFLERTLKLFVTS